MEILSEFKKGQLDAADLAEASFLKGNPGVRVDLPYRYPSAEDYQKALQVASETRAKREGLEMAATKKPTAPRLLGRIVGSINEVFRG